MMERTITVKGVGHAAAKPNLVVISMLLSTIHKDYERAMDNATESIDALQRALYYVGFEKGDLKTTDFNVDTEYESTRDSNGNCKRTFVGYRIRHSLKLSFDFDTKMLARTICAIARCDSHPELSIAFTVKDATEISEELLRTATVNARRKAEILCNASGVKLGDIVNVIYDWTEINLLSRTRFMDNSYYSIGEKCMDIEPEDIDVCDSVTFVWSIR